jgi:hypothetical protein
MAVSASQLALLFVVLPLDGLRKAAERVDITPPDRKLNVDEQKRVLTDAFMAKMQAGTLKQERPPLAISPEAMWATCKRLSPPPLKTTVGVLPVASKALLLAVKAHFEEKLLPVIQELGAPLKAICAGKATSFTKSAEKSGFAKRWRNRYGLVEFGYTHMLRVYVDNSATPDYKAREQTALAIEEYLFTLLADHFGTDIVAFSAEPGRQSKKTSPEWQAMVYIALKLEQ